MAGKRKAVKRDTVVLSPVCGQAPVALPADCRIAVLPMLKDTLLGALGDGAVALDGRQVERTDTAALQLLLLFRRELAARGGSLSWTGVSEALHEAASLLGLTQTLELPAPASA